AVVGVTTADQNELLRTSDCVPIPAGELCRGVDRVGPARGEEHLAVLERSKVGEPLREREDRFVRVSAEGRVRVELPQLALDGGGDLLPAVADVAVPECGSRIEVGAAFAVDELAAAPADDHQLFADIRHI